MICLQQEHVASKTLVQQNDRVLNLDAS